MAATVWKHCAHNGRGSAAAIGRGHPRPPVGLDCSTCCSGTAIKTEQQMVAAPPPDGGRASGQRRNVIRGRAIRVLHDNFHAKRGLAHTWPARAPRRFRNLTWPTVGLNRFRRFLFREFAQSTFDEKGILVTHRQSPVTQFAPRFSQAVRHDERRTFRRPDGLIGMRRFIVGRSYQPAQGVGACLSIHLDAGRFAARRDEPPRAGKIAGADCRAGRTGDALPDPSIESALRKLAEQKVDETLLIPLFPHYAMSSYETAVVRVQQVARKARAEA